MILKSGSRFSGKIMLQYRKEMAVHGFPMGGFSVCRRKKSIKPPQEAP